MKFSAVVPALLLEMLANSGMQAKADPAMSWTLDDRIEGEQLWCSRLSARTDRIGMEPKNPVPPAFYVPGWPSSFLNGLCTAAFFSTAFTWSAMR